MQTLEPVAVATNIISPAGLSAGYLVIGQDKEIPSCRAKPGVWLSFGDHVWYLSNPGTKKLRDFCNAVLAPALDANAKNPGGERAAAVPAGEINDDLAL